MKTISYFSILMSLTVSTLTARFHENLYLRESDIKNAQTISHCIGQATKALFTPFNDVSIIMSNRYHNPMLLREMLMESLADRTVKVFTKFSTEADDESRDSVRKSSFVLIGNHANYRQIMGDHSIDRWAEYIIVVQSTTQWLSKFADHLWYLGFIKVAFVHVTANGTRITLLRSMQNPSSRGSLPSLRASDLCNENVIQNVALPKKLKEDTIAVHPFSYMIHIPTNATFKFSKITEGTSDDLSRLNADGNRTSLGIDIMQMFATKYKMELVKVSWENEEVSSWMDAAQRCVAEEFDIFYSHELPPWENCCKQIVVLSWYTFQTLGFVDRRKVSLSPFMSLIQPDSESISLYNFVVLGIFIIFAYVMDVFWSQHLVRERITILQIWAIFTDQSLPALPAKFGLRFVFGLWILYNLNMNLMYTSTFSSALTATDRNNILKSYQDILDSGRPICGSNKTKQILNDANDPIILKIGDRMEPIISTDVISKIFNENYIGARNLKDLMTYNWANRANNSLKLYTVSEATIVTYPSSYFIKKGHPWSKEFNRLVANARDSGVLAYISQQNSERFGKTSDDHLLATTDEAFISMKHLQPLFNFLLIGYFISGVVFLVELYMRRKLVNRPNRQDFSKT